MPTTQQADTTAAPTTETPTAAAAPVDQAPQAGQVQVNVDFLKTTRVHICMPCYGGMLTESTFMSYIKWSNTCRQLGIDWTMETMTNESLISRARNTLTAKFLNNPDSTHLLFIDADIGFEPWHILVLLNRQVDVIGGLYPMKTLPVKWVVNGFDGAEEGEDGLQEVSKTGTGFMLIKRDVFEKLHAQTAYQGLTEFRWRAEEWPVTMNKGAAESYLEKNDSYWLDNYNKEQADKEQTAAQQKPPAQQLSQQELASTVPPYIPPTRPTESVSNNYRDNRTGFARRPREDDERHDLDVARPLIYGLKINGKIWKKDGNTVTFFTKERALSARDSILAKRPDVEVGLLQRPQD